MKSLCESILSSTKSGANSVVLNNFVKYLKSIIDDDSVGYRKFAGPAEKDVYIPGTSHQTRLDGVFKFWFPRIKYKTKTKQLIRMLEKSGYQSEYEATGTIMPSFSFDLSKVQDKVYYSSLEDHLNLYWDNHIFKIVDVYIVLSYLKAVNSSIATLYVYALNEDRTISQTLTSEIEKQLR